MKENRAKAIDAAITWACFPGDDFDDEKAADIFQAGMDDLHEGTAENASAPPRTSPTDLDPRTSRGLLVQR